MTVADGEVCYVESSHISNEKVCLQHIAHVFLDVKISSISQLLKLCWHYFSLSRILLSQIGVLQHLFPASVELSQVRSGH